MAQATSVSNPYGYQRDARSNALLDWVLEHFEEHEESRVPVRRMSYQRLLRALGAWLDTNRACNVNLIEASAGFIIRYGLGEESLLLHRYILTYAELEHLEASMKERNSLHPSGRYQNFLRALGYEIDAQAGAYLVLDQVEENIFLTFLQPGQEGGLTWNKRARVLDPNDQAAILGKAHARRESPEPAKGFWQRIWQHPRGPIKETEVA